MPDNMTLAQKLAFLDWLTLEDTARQADYRKYREYYDGDHTTRLTDRLREFLKLNEDDEFNVNVCPLVVDSLAERLTVTGFTAGDQAETLWNWWNTNRMDGVQRVVHTAACRDADTYVIVEWNNDEKRPVFTHELACCDGIGVKVHYGQKRGVVDFASKRWRVEQGPGAGVERRMNLYYPDRIEKYISDDLINEGQWKLSEELPWKDSNGQVLGVPVFHFKNRDEGYNYGLSELKSAVPLQDAINKTLVDLMLTADYYSFPQPYALGFDPGGLKVGPGLWIWSGNREDKVGLLPSEDPAKLISLLDNLMLKVASVTKTPLTTFQLFGQVPAEGTQKQLEADLVAKARDRMTVFGNAWEDAMKMARRLNNAFGDEQMDGAEPINTTWADPETRNEVEHLNALGIKREKLGIPLETLWAEAGYTPEQIEDMKNSDEYKSRLALMQMAQSAGSDNG